MLNEIITANKAAIIKILKEDQDFRMAIKELIREVNREGYL